MTNSKPSNVRTFEVEGLRAIPSDNPDVLFVAKYFVSGKPKSKAITVAMRDAGATVNLTANTISLPVGKRGRRPTASLSQDEIAALLS